MKNEVNSMTRDDRFEVIERRPEVSVLIVGGGINGIGLLRELALQGIDALLVEKSDFCSGASAASTRIIHGGLRYLENGEFRLVRESLQERNRLLKNAPHYVRPLAITIPVFSWADGLFQPLRGFSASGRDRATEEPYSSSLGYRCMTYWREIRRLCPATDSNLGVIPWLLVLSSRQGSYARQHITTPGSVIPSGSASNSFWTLSAIVQAYTL